MPHPQPIQQDIGRPESKERQREVKREGLSPLGKQPAKLKPTRKLRPLLKSPQVNDTASHREGHPRRNAHRQSASHHSPFRQTPLRSKHELAGKSAYEEMQATIAFAKSEALERSETSSSDEEPIRAVVRTRTGHPSQQQ